MEGFVEMLQGELSREFLRGFASWAGGGAVGPLLMASFAALWGGANAARGSAEQQRDSVYKRALAPRKETSPRPLIEFHRAVRDAYCDPKSLPQLKRDGTLPKLAEDATSLSGDEMAQAYITEIRKFLAECFAQTNKSKALDKSFNEASEKLPKPDGQDSEWTKITSCVRQSNFFGWAPLPIFDHRRWNGAETRHAY